MERVAPATRSDSIGWYLMDAFTANLLQSVTRWFASKTPSNDFDS